MAPARNFSPLNRPPQLALDSGRVQRRVRRAYVATGKLVGRVFLSPDAPEGRQWMWTLAQGYHQDHTPAHGYEPTREAAMAAFAKSWRREM